MRLTKPALASLIVILTLATLAQTTAPAPTVKVYARETIVDVTVTDAKGNPVHGLTQTDFTVKENNKPQPIRRFALSLPASRPRFPPKSLTPPV
jgi:hypothetical protein